MNGNSKQKRRYSCQSWNVAAKVVLNPEVFESDTEDEQFETAIDHFDESDNEDDLVTCKDDVSESTVSDTLVNQEQHHDNNGTAEDILRMCAKAQDKIRRSLLLEDLPHEIKSISDIEKVNSMVNDCDSETFHITDCVDKSKTQISSDVSKTLLVDKSESMKKDPETPRTIKREGSKIFVPNWNQSQNSESSKTIQVFSDQSSRTMMNSNENPKENSEFSSSETLCIDESLSETYVEPNTESTTLNFDETNSPTFIVAEKIGDISNNSWTIHDPDSITVKCESSIDSETLPASSATIPVNDGSNHAIDQHEASETVIVENDEITNSITLSRETSVTTFSRESSVSLCSSRSNNSKLFSRIKERYERSVSDSVSPQPQFQIQPKKIIRDINFSQSSVVKYQNIPFDKENVSNNHNRIKSKLTELYQSDEKTSKKPIQKPAADDNKTVNSKSIQNNVSRVNNKIDKVEKLEASENVQLEEKSNSKINSQEPSQKSSTNVMKVLQNNDTGKNQSTLSDLGYSKPQKISKEIQPSSKESNSKESIEPNRKIVKTKHTPETMLTITKFTNIINVQFE